MLPRELAGVWKIGNFSVKSFQKCLPPDYSVEQQNSADRSGILRDTFDGCLRRAGQVLIQQSDSVRLIDLNTGRTEEQEISNDWTFAHDLKGGPVGFQCLERSPLRAFSRISTVEVQIVEWAVRDELEKTVVRFSSISLIRGSKKAVWINLKPMRGYDEDAQCVFQALEACGFRADDFDYFPMIGIRMPFYEAKPAVDISPRSPIVENAGRIVETFITTARQNEPGILEDLDTEFLHDYRVSLRKVRSLLSLFKGVYADDFNASVKFQLAQTMKQTNRLRDLDVYLLDREMFYDMVPESQYAGLDIMFDIFTAERAEALDQVRAVLTDSEYPYAMDTMLKNFQSLEKEHRGPAAEENTLAFAQRLILKRYKKIASIARAIDSDTPEAEVHELRIQCKKLRYLMEFFMPLFPKKRIKPLVRSLKGLQDLLGRFNDYCVQRESLASFVQTHPMRGKKGLKVAESVGALVATLFQLQKRARRDVESNLELFVNTETAAAFKRLCSTG